MPTICGTVLTPLQGGVRTRGHGSVLLACTRPGVTAAYMPARLVGGAFAQLCLGEDGTNFAVSERHRLCSWGVFSPSGLLGRRPTNGQSYGEIMPPARLPAFIRLSLSVEHIALGENHVAALTHHGRVFTWGQLECCLKPEDGFKRHNIAEPVYVEGALKDLRVAHVAAGVLETAVSLHQSNTLLGWESLELSPLGNRFLPNIFHFTRSIRGVVGRLSMCHSDSLQVLLAECEGPDPNEKAVSSAPFTASPKAWQSRKFGSLLNEREQKEQAMANKGRKPIAIAKPKASASDVTALKLWSERRQQASATRSEDLQPCRAAVKMTSVNLKRVMASKELVELDRDLAGFRRLAEHRSKDATLWGLGEEGYEDDDDFGDL